MRSLSILTAMAVLLFSPLQASAESFLLFSSGYWDVRYEVSDSGRESCSAMVQGDGLYFSIDVTKGEGLDAWYINPLNNFGPKTQEGVLDIRVDQNRSWITPASAQDDTIRMIGLTEKFLRQVMNGRRLMIDTDQDGQWDAWFSLYGSAAAIYTLNDCKNKL